MSAFNIPSLERAMVEKLILPQVKSSVPKIIDEDYIESTLQPYALELNKVIKMMENSYPSEINTPFKGNCLDATSNEKYFVFGSIDGKLAVLDRVSKEIVNDTILNGSVLSICLYNNNFNLLAAGQDGIIRKFDFPTLAEIKEFEGHEKEVNSLVFSKTKNEFYSASDDQTVLSWNEETGQSTILFTHERAVLCLNLSNDGKYLVSGGADKSIKIFDFEVEVVIKSLADFSTSVWSVQISDKNTYLAGGDGNGTINLYDFSTFELVKTFSEHEKRVTCLKFNLSETVLISSSNDTTLRVWNLAEEKSEIIMTGHSDWIKSFIISNDESTLYSIAENFKILVWNFPRFDKSCRKSCHALPIKFMCYSKHYESLFTSDSTDVKVWNIEDKNVTKTLKCKYKISTIALDHGGEDLLIGYVNKSVHFWHLDSPTSEKMFDHPSIISKIIASHDKRLIVIGDENFRVTVLKRPRYKVLHVFKKHTNVITALQFILPLYTDSKEFFSGSEDGSIFLYDISGPTTTKYAGHSAGVSCLTSSRKNDLFISGDTAGHIKIWNTKTQVCVKTLSLHTGKITGLCFSENMKHFWAFSQDSSYSLWSFLSYNLISQLKTKHPISCFCCFNHDSDMVLAEDNELHFFVNLLKTNQFFMYGPGKDYYAFMRYVLEISQGNDVEHDPEMDKWIIAPYEVNALHFYTYFNMPHHLKLALKAKSPFYFSKMDYSPIQIAIHRNFRDCINVIIKNIVENIQQDPYSIIYIEDSITILNRIGFRGLDQFYNDILFKSTSRDLPKFCDESVELPAFAFSPTMNPHQSLFFGSDSVTNCGTPINFWQCPLKFNSEIGSKGSIEFLESLVDSPNSNIFTSQVIKELVGYKWKYVKWALLPQAIVYFLYMISLSYYMIYLKSNDKDYLISIFIINVALALYEIFQMILTKYIYFKDIWNYLDLIRSMLGFYYIIATWKGYSLNTNNQILSLLIFMSCVRGISYFRLFDNTRYMVNLLSEVISDITSFLILLTYSTFSFALVYFIMIKNIDPSDKKEFMDYIADSYLLSLGNFKTDGYGAFEWGIFFFASVINPLIMLNLLISIMGDTYGRVKEEQETADMKELTEMVIEGEYILFCKRKSYKKMYFQIFKEEEVTNPDYSVDDKLNKLKIRIKALEEAVIVKGDEMKSETRSSIFGVNKKIDEITETIEKITLTQD